jgi:NADH-quinone oxidoreductase subunit N
MFVAAIRGVKANLETVRIKYFIIQRIGSSVFLSGVVLGALQVTHNLLRVFIGIRLVLKLGVAPLHGWFIRVLSQLSWEFLVLASTLQKVLPLYLFSLITFELLVYILVLSVAVRVVGSINLLETKKLLAYSSIFRAVWMLSCNSIFPVLAQYLGAYAVALGVLVGPLAVERRVNLNEVLAKNNKSKTLICLIGFFSLGGSPPFLGFYAKILVAQVVLAGQQMVFLLYLVSSSVFLLYVYLRFFYQAVTTSGPETEARVPEYFYGGALVLALFLLVIFPWF